jgi:hypothetical protein
MNAHINHDLAHAVFDLAVARGHAPTRGTAEHDDFLRINQILASTIDEVKPWLLDGVLREIDGAIGRVDDAVGIFSIEHAREAAWTAAETLWALRDLPELSADFETSLDRLVGMASRAMITIATV